MKDAHATAPTAFDPHRLDVYAVALEFHRLAGALVPTRGHGHVRDQFARASLSIVLNIAEGAGRFSRRDKARFYAIAHGSACECAAILDVLQADRAEARALLVRIVRMLNALIARMRASGAGNAGVRSRWWGVARAIAGRN